MTTLRSPLLFALLAGCVPVAAAPTTADGTPVLMPTVADPLRGLPALSGDGRTVALPAFSTGERGQERSITFIGLGDTEGSGKTLDVSGTPTDRQIGELLAQLGAEKFASMPWVVTPDDPPLPMTITVNGTELYFAGDPKTQLSLSVLAAGQPIGNDIYHVEGETETSPEHVVAIGAAVTWTQDRGYAYVRYDVNDGKGRESAWRVVTLARPPAAAPAVAQPPAAAK